MPNCLQMNAACVPLPAPGAPSRISRIASSCLVVVVVADTTRKDAA
jgi:hypothetical protein